MNQYFPPDPAPTGILFAELAEECRARGHEVDFVDAAQDYRAAGQQPQKGGRMKRELAALRRMVRAGKARPRADVIISGSSPPCLAVFADRVARKHRARHLHWAMDVYPEIAAALGEIKPAGLIARITGWLMGRAYRRCAAVVALDADMSGVLSRHGVAPEVIRPWVFRSLLEQLNETGGMAPKAAPASVFTCLYSGNLGRAHDYETLLRAQRLLEDRGSAIRLKFQGGGPGTPAAQTRARDLGLRQCEFAPYVAEDALVLSLLDHDVLAVTQRLEAKGLLWPSKLGLVTALPRQILFIGPTDGAIAAELRQFSRAGVFAPGDSEGVAAWLAAREAAPSRVERLVDPARHRAQALEDWLKLIAR